MEIRGHGMGPVLTYTHSNTGGQAPYRAPSATDGNDENLLLANLLVQRASHDGPFGLQIFNPAPPIGRQDISAQAIRPSAQSARGSEVAAGFGTKTGKGRGYQPPGGKPPTQEADGKESFPQDEQQLVPQGLAEDVTESREMRRSEALDKEIAAAQIYWKRIADAKDWGTIKADISVFQNAGVKVEVSPRESKAYADKVLEGLKFLTDEQAKKEHPDLSREEVEAAREVLRRKAAAFWVEDTPRTTVRHVKHDTIPTGPPCRLPPHSLRGELADWIDQKLQEEVDRGQLVRGNSPWGSPPFPTKDMPDHKKARKRRIVVDYLSLIHI